MRQANSDHITSVIDCDISRNHSAQYADPNHPDIALFAAWKGREQALREYYAGDSDDLYDAVDHFNKIIRSHQAKTPEGLSVQIGYLLSDQVREFYPDGMITDFLLSLLGQVGGLARDGKLQILSHNIAKNRDLSRDGIGDAGRDLDCAMVNVEAGIGVLTALADGYCATGEDVSSEAVTWLAGKLGEDVRRLSAAVDAYQSAAGR